MAEVKKIKTSYVIIWNHDPIIIVNDKKKADYILERATERGKKNLVARKITGTPERIKEIGINLFERKVPGGMDPISYRNAVVKECLRVKEKFKIESDELVWEKVKPKCQCGDITWEEFCKWTLDMIDFSRS